MCSSPITLLQEAQTLFSTHRRAYAVYYLQLVAGRVKPRHTDHDPPGYAASFACLGFGPRCGLTT